MQRHSLHVSGRRTGFQEQTNPVRRRESCQACCPQEHERTAKFIQVNSERAIPFLHQPPRRHAHGRLSVWTVNGKPSQEDTVRFIGTETLHTVRQTE
jgi:hypothetical protein